jgi:integrase/recombinase XerD
MIMWDSFIQDFKTFLKIEKSLSDNSIDAYINDVNKFAGFLDDYGQHKKPGAVDLADLKRFAEWCTQLGLGARTQARIISGIRSFFKYLLIENIIDNDPTKLFDSPKTGRKLPEVLTIEEIDQIVGQIDLSKPEGHRNKAIIETLYCCGLRVSELINLRLSDLYLKHNYIKVTGKGNKERLVPISNTAIEQIKIYETNYRRTLKIDKLSENILFLNRRGKKLTRVMIFTITKKLVEMAEIKKNISPHSFRHSFASHLVDRGADLRAVQEMLGHESIITTEVYTHLNQQYLRDTIIQFHPRANKTKYDK